MKTIELLAPAGSYEALVAAVQNGCDAIYLGGVMFGARAFANNFDEQQLKEAVQYAHRYGVRVFVTVNTLIKETEMEACMSYIQSLQESDVDALIIQDIGLFTYIHKRFPDFELHASTQMHIHNPEGIKLLQEMGAARVVVPRETTIEEIANYAKLDVDLEVFVQGALCVSYSGQCLMSAETLSRSGNRGECAQSCRMQYDLVKQEGSKQKKIPTKGSYLLSPKDLNTLAQVPQLIEAGITSFKIEGRMKRPEYVAQMVASYRKAIDAYIDGRDVVVDEKTKEDMEKIFNRGFTSGHLFHAMGSRLMNVERPNHIGVAIGEVVGFHHDKIQIKLSKDIHQGDGIRIISSRSDEGFTLNRIYKQGLLVNQGCKGDIIEIDKTCYVEKGSRVVVTSDLQQLKQLQMRSQSNGRRVNIYASFTMHQHQVAMLDVWDDEGHYIHCESMQECVKAHNTPLSKQRVQEQLSKTKDTPFDIIDIVFDMDETSVIAIKEINQLRRNALTELEKQREQRNIDRRVCEVEPYALPKAQVLPPYIVVIHTQEQYDACKANNIEEIYVDNTTLYKELCHDSNVFLKTPRVMKTNYVDGSYMVEEHGGLYKNQSVLCGPSCNVSNHNSVEFMLSKQTRGVCVSYETTLEECKEIQKSFYSIHGYYANVVYPVYGRHELMISKYCVINAQIKDSDKKNCQLCKQDRYALVDMKKHTYPIQCDEFCQMHILSESAHDQLYEIDEAKRNHINTFLCVFTMERYEECGQVLQRLQEACA